MLRQLRDLLADLSLQEISKLTFVRPPTLSGYFNAARLPALQTAGKLYEMARERATAAGIAMPFDQEQLKTAHQNAQLKPCRSCPVRIVGARTAPVTVPEPATQSAPMPTSSSTAEGSAPVPLSVGDRQRGSDSPWVTTGKLEQLLIEGKKDDARVIIQHAGISLEISEIPIAVDSCRAAGLDDAANAILHYAGSRVASEVLQLAHELITAGQYGDATTLLGAAVSG